MYLTVLCVQIHSKWVIQFLFKILSSLLSKLSSRIVIDPIENTHKNKRTTNKTLSHPKKIPDHSLTIISLLRTKRETKTLFNAHGSSFSSHPQYIWDNENKKSFVWWFYMWIRLSCSHAPLSCTLSLSLSLSLSHTHTYPHLIGKLLLNSCYFIVELVLYCWI